MKVFAKVSLLLTVLALMAAGCASRAEPKADQPHGEGYIAQIGESQVLVLDHMKQEDIGKTWNELFEDYQGEAIWLRTSDADSFKVGQKVRYWVDGAIAESFPEQASAGKIEVIGDAAPKTGGAPAEPLENSAFRNVQVTGTGGQYTVTGEARVFEAVMNYAVSDGHQDLLEHSVKLDEGAPAWSPFTLNLSVPAEQRPANGTLTLELFELSAKDGSQTNMLSVPLETFGS